MFTGSYLHTIDSKGRLSIPASFREILIANHGGKLILTNDLVDKCIVAYTLHSWEELEVKLRKASSMDRDIKAFSRKFFASAELCSLDNQGRILISQRLRDYASLTREALVAAAANDKIEIWNPSLWEQAVVAIDSEAVGKKMAELGI